MITAICILKKYSNFPKHLQGIIVGIVKKVSLPNLILRPYRIAIGFFIVS